VRIRPRLSGARKRTNERRWLVPTALAVTALAVASCSSSGSSTSESGSANNASSTASSAAHAGSASKCGLGTGQKATGTPIKLGAIVTNIPGLSFTDDTGMAKAYFDCVNDNGGIHGHPIDYVVKEDALDPQVTASRATYLLDTAKVSGIVASMSVLDCSVNGANYVKQNLRIIDVGTSLECFSSPALAPVNDGPSFSALSTAKYLLDAGAKKLVIFTSNTPGSDAINQSIKLLGKAKGVPVQAWLENVPVNDANGLALRAVQAAGNGGGVVVNFTPGEAIKVFKAAQQQGVMGQVKWGCPAGCNDASFVKELGSAWDGKLGIDAEMNIVGAGGPDDQLYRMVHDKYGSSTHLGNFGELGFTAARIATQALLAMPANASYTTASVSKAFQDVTHYASDLYCKPWYFGPQAFHAANNATRIVTASGGKFKQIRGCQDIPALPNNHFAEIRAYEKTLGTGN